MTSYLLRPKTAALTKTSLYAPPTSQVLSPSRPPKPSASKHIIIIRRLSVYPLSLKQQNIKSKLIFIWIRRRFLWVCFYLFWYYLIVYDAKFAVLSIYPIDSSVKRHAANISQCAFSTAYTGSRTFCLSISFSKKPPHLREQIKTQIISQRSSPTATLACSYTKSLSKSSSLNPKDSALKALSSALWIAVPISFAVSLSSVILSFLSLLTCLK